MTMRTYLFILAMLCFGSVTAQPPLTPPPNPSEVPLDGFSALLLAAGVGYGAKRLRKKKGVEP